MIVTRLESMRSMNRLAPRITNNAEKKIRMMSNKNE